MKKLTTLATSLLMAFGMSGSVQAEDLFTECSSCTSESRFYNVASYVGTNNGTDNDVVYVLNSDTGTMHKYSVVNLSYRDSIFFEPIVEELALTAEDITNKYQLMEDINALRSYVYDVPTDVAGSAYDLIGLSQMQNLVESSYLNNQSIITRISNYFAIVALIAGKIISAVNFTIDVAFSDGSKATFKVTGIDGNAEFTLELLSAVDSGNRDIPITKDKMLTNGAMVFEGNSNTDSSGSGGGTNNLQEYLNAAARLGITMTINGKGGDDVETTCKVNASGGLTCSPS